MGHLGSRLVPTPANLTIFEKNDPGGMGSAGNNGYINISSSFGISTMKM